MKTNDDLQPIQKDATTGRGENNNHILLVTSPEKMSFAFKYILAFTPCILVFVSIITGYLLDIIIGTFSTAVSTTMNDAMSSGN